MIAPSIVISNLSTAASSAVVASTLRTKIRRREQKALNAKQANVLITNESDKPLQLKLPKVIAAVPALGQFGQNPNQNQNQNGNPVGGGTNQGVGGGFNIGNGQGLGNVGRI